MEKIIFFFDRRTTPRKTNVCLFVYSDLLLILVLTLQLRVYHVCAAENWLYTYVYHQWNPCLTVKKMCWENGSGLTHV